MDNSQSDQAENAHPDPLRRRVEQVGANRHAGDEYDISNDIYPKRHQTSPEEQMTPLYSSRPVHSVRKHTYVQGFNASGCGVGTLGRLEHKRTGLSACLSARLDSRVSNGPFRDRDVTRLPHEGGELPVGDRIHVNQNDPTLTSRTGAYSG